MVFETLFIVLSTLGIIDAGYLTYKHARKQPLMCPIGDDCSAVTESKWSHMLGIRNEVLGLVYYGGIFLTILGALLIPGLDGRITKMMPLATGVGLLFSLFFVYLQAAAIRKYCFYCLLSALISLLLFLTSLALSAS